MSAPMDALPQVIHETVERSPAGAIIFDASLMPDASQKTFSAAGWKTVRAVENVLHSGGRGNTLILGDGRQEYVLRHFRRGGLIGRFIRDSYLWLGEDRTRPFAEWRVLQKLANAGLPVPRPADIITVRVPGIRSLSACLHDTSLGEDVWCRIGAGLCDFHDNGVNHADLNAHNVQLDGNGHVWLLDFDRARIMPQGAWRQKNLARLHRSLQKIRRLEARVRYTESCWKALLEGYFQASRSA